MKDDGSKTINARVAGDVYRAIESLTGGPFDVTQAQVIRRLLAEALAARGILPDAGAQTLPEPVSPSPAPAPSPKRTERPIRGSRAS